MIFIVDDDASVRTSLTRLLRSAGHEVQAFGNAGECLSRLDEEGTKVQCLLVDLHMPGVSGLDLQEIIHSRKLPLPVIFLSGTEDVELTTIAMAPGVARVLRKPCDAAVLLAAVAEVSGQDHVSQPASSETPMNKLTEEFGTRGVGMGEPDNFVLEAEHAVYRPVGSVTFDQAVALVRAAISAARRKDVRDLLVDTTAWTGFSSPDTFQRFLAAVQWAEAARKGARLAMVARDEMIHPQKIGVLVAANRGLMSNIFNNEKDARAWLAALNGK